MIRIAKWLVIYLLTTMISGCWDLKDLQDINYINAYGVDYVDNEYIVYVQLISFSTTAKTEGSKPEKPVPTWVGKGTGESLVAAFNDLYDTAQIRLFYGQISAIVYSENVLKKGLKEAFDFHNRYYELRYTPWVFGTKTEIDKIFAVPPMLDLSPLASILHQPEESYSQKSLIAPISFREFIVDYREPGKTALLPSLTLLTHEWEDVQQQKPMMAIDGVFTLHNEAYKGWLSKQDVPGLRWIEPRTIRSSLNIPSNKKLLAELILESPKVKVISHAKDREISGDIHVKLTGYVGEELKPHAQSTLEAEAAKLVRQQIQQTFESGLKINADPLQLEHALYRQKNSLWKTMRKQGNLKLTSDSLDKIKVEVQLEHTGKLKMRNH